MAYNAINIHQKVKQFIENVRVTSLLQCYKLNCKIVSPKRNCKKVWKIMCKEYNIMRTSVDTIIKYILNST